MNSLENWAKLISSSVLAIEKNCKMYIDVMSKSKK